MEIRKILTEPDPILRQKSLEVKVVDKDLQARPTAEQCEQLDD